MDGSSSSSAAPKARASPWQALGVSSDLARALTHRGFKQPTPIQRATLPLSLGTPARDVLGMARTGSGKTLAYLVPLVHRLSSNRSRLDGPRALVLCPSRELALQILKTGKDLARAIKGGGEVEHRLRWTMIIGGEAMDKQFEAMTSKPDIVIATPGRFLHLAVEMNLDLRGIEMVIYDEADRLFEMGFDVQLREIVHRIPPTRQSLLFSATLPTTVAEFARAGLVNPALVRLDADHNLSPELDLAFFSVSPNDKPAALLVVLDHIFQSSTGLDRSGKRDQAIIFVATKHHVEYMNNLLEAAGYATSHVYGSLDQVARQRQLRLFRDGETDLLVVTDVAARGLDIPIMDHVINYDFPASGRVFVHRVGRTARAGRKGAAWSLVTSADLPYLVDLQILLDRPLLDQSTRLYGQIPRQRIDEKTEYLASTLDESAPQLKSLRQVMQRGESMVQRSRSKASPKAYREAKGLQRGATADATHPAFADKANEVDDRRNILLETIGAYQPRDTVLEIGRSKDDPSGRLMQARRDLLKKRSTPRTVNTNPDTRQPVQPGDQRKSFQDPDFFMSHASASISNSKKFSIRENDSFTSQLRSATLDLTADEGQEVRAQKASQLRWDRKRKRFARVPENDGNEQKMVRTESGNLLPATFNSGRFKEWKAKNFRMKQSLDSGSRVTAPKGELLSAEDVRRRRSTKTQRKLKNARPTRKN